MIIFWHSTIWIKALASSVMLCSLAKKTLKVSLLTQEYKWLLAYCQRNQLSTSMPSRERLFRAQKPEHAPHTSPLNLGSQCRHD